MLSDYPKNSQVVEGGLIDWPSMESRKIRNGTMYMVPVECGLCHKRRVVQAASLLSAINLGKTTGRCRSCAPLVKREKILERYRDKGIEMLDTGAAIDWLTIDAPPAGISGKPYTVECVCVCGFRRRRTVPTIYKNSGLCRQCSANNVMRSGPDNGNWKGGGLTHQGYKITRIPPDHPMIEMAEVVSNSGWGKVLEHRLFMAMHIGRCLEVWEHVHHINQDKTDNRIDNLQLVTPDKHATISSMEREIRKLRDENKQLRASLVLLLQNRTIES